MFRWPWEYCSITSRTSYGFRAWGKLFGPGISKNSPTCWNFRRATKYLIFLTILIAFLCFSVRLSIRCYWGPFNSQCNNGTAFFLVNRKRYLLDLVQRGWVSPSSRSSRSLSLFPILSCKHKCLSDFPSSSVRYPGFIRADEMMDGEKELPWIQCRWNDGPSFAKFARAHPTAFWSWSRLMSMSMWTLILHQSWWRLLFKVFEALLILPPSGTMSILMWTLG